MEKLYLIYQLALNKLKNKFDSLYLEFSTLEDNNPIEHLKYRIKKLDSIEEKLKKKSLPPTYDNISKLNDIVGVRIVCSFLNDLEKIIKIIENDPEIKILNHKDYITNPKNNGYTSYHLIIEIPVSLLNETVYVKAEIQVRTIAMDMWASLEHKIWYKKGIQLPQDMMEEIYKTTKVCRLVDNNLNKLSEQAPDSSQKQQLDCPLEKDKRYEITILKYQAALKFVEDKINTIYNEYEINGLTNPIEHIKSRIKTSERIVQKLIKQHQELTLDNMENYINDIAGIRIVCSFQSDLEEIISLLKRDETMKIIREKDYVSIPKASGYSAYHLIVQVPIHLKSQTTYVKVEIQIRTIAMDMWASLEHKLCYQKEVDSSITAELKNLASVIRVIDNNMEKTIQKSRNLVTEKKRSR